MRTFREVNNHGGSDVESWTMDHPLRTITRVRRLRRRLIPCSALCMFGKNCFLLCSVNSSHFHQPCSITLPSYEPHINPRTASYAIIFDACRLHVLRGHQGCHRPPASCSAQGRVQNPEGHVFAFLLSHLASLLPIPTHYQRCVSNALILS